MTMLLLCVLAVIALGAAFIALSRQTEYFSESLRGASGKVYPYRLGDHLPYFYGGTFSGIDILLPARLPNIFLDGKVREDTVGSRHFYNSNQALQLEGDFNKYFTLYVPKDYQVLALSILTPDVMQTLMREAPDCDVEIYKEHLRIITSHKLKGRTNERAVLVRSANVILQEIDDKLRSWSESNSQSAKTALLQSEDNPTIKLFGKRFRASTFIIAPVFGFYCLLAWPAWLVVMAGGDNWPLSTPPLSWWVHYWWPPFLVFPVLWLFLIFAIPRDWLKRFVRTIKRKFHSKG